MTTVDLTRSVLTFDHRQLTQDELNSIWSPHLRYWQNLTQDEIKSRKEEWKLIQRSLKEYGATEFRGSYLKQHKELFFTGSVNPDLISDNGRQGNSTCSGTFSLFYLWYHPKLTQELCRELISHFAQSFFSLSGRLYDLETMRSRLFHRLGQGDYTINGEYGFMGERMSIIAPNLLGEKGEGCLIDSGANAAPIPPAGPIWVMVGSCGALFNPESCIYQTGNYIWPQASYYLDKYVLEFAQLLREDAGGGFLPQDEMVKRNKLKGAQVVLEQLIKRVESLVFFRDIAEIKHDHPNAIACYKMLMSQYEGGEYSPILNAVFELVKKKGISKVKPKQLLDLV